MRITLRDNVTTRSLHRSRCRQQHLRLGASAVLLHNSCKRYLEETAMPLSNTVLKQCLHRARSQKSAHRLAVTRKRVADELGSGIARDRYKGACPNCPAAAETKNDYLGRLAIQQPTRLAPRNGSDAVEKTSTVLDLMGIPCLQDINVKHITKIASLEQHSRAVRGGALQPLAVVAIHQLTTSNRCGRCPKDRSDRASATKERCPMLTFKAYRERVICLQVLLTLRICVACNQQRTFQR